MNTQSKYQRLQELTQRITELPTLPTVVDRMTALVDDPKTSAIELGRLISTDQALTVKLLKLANSSYYGFSRQISTINLAIVVLGFDTVKHLGLSLSVIDRFRQSSSQDLFDVQQFWEHSIGCGVASGMLAKEFRYRISAEVFVAGLLHDIGKIILNLYLKEELKAVLDLIAGEGCAFIEAEERIIGVTHADIGRWLAERWNLPSQLVESIAFHHRPGEAKDAVDIATLVHLGDILCRMGQVGYSGDDTIPQIDEQAMVILQRMRPSFDEQHLEQYLVKFLNELEKSEMFTVFAKRKPAEVVHEPVV
jgi:HD-like signal output (HDOD) protein